VIDTAVRGGGILKHFKVSLLWFSLLGLLPNNLFAQIPASQAISVAVPQGTKIELALMRPLWALTAKAGDTVYAQTSFPAAVSGGLAIPAGTFVQGTIEDVTRPTRRTSRAEIQVLFTRIIFANGYVVALPGATDLAPGTAVSESFPAQNETLIAITVQVSAANDLLLDNGAELEMTLGGPLQLDAKQIAQAIPLTRAPQPAQFKSATLCRPTSGTPGTPGTSDTVIPGSPGTPSTTIPGGPGMPDITIPGTPATPDTVIPGSPGSPGFAGTSCPAKPLVISCALVVRSSQTANSQPVATR
jgi:hypothetical protein